jgi:hypothetical protein
MGRLDLRPEAKVGTGELTGEVENVEVVRVGLKRVLVLEVVLIDCVEIVELELAVVLDGLCVTVTVFTTIFSPLLTIGGVSFILPCLLSTQKAR